jgi:hypothetical protein
MVQTVAQNIIQNRMDGKDWLSSVFMLQTFKTDDTIYNPYFIAYVVVWLRLNANRLVKWKHCGRKTQFIRAVKLIAAILENPKKYPVYGKYGITYVPYIAKTTGLNQGDIQKFLSKHLRRETKHILRTYKEDGLYALLMSDF